MNSTPPSEPERRERLLRAMFAELGEGCYIEPPLHANWGGAHVHFGSNVFANFALTLVDDTHIYVGDCTMLGPNVTIATAAHPVLPELREKAYQYNLPVHIGRNCWLGAGVIVLPGVSIGDNTVARPARQRRGRGQPLPRAAGNYRTRPGILRPRPPHRTFRARGRVTIRGGN